MLYRSRREYYCNIVNRGQSDLPVDASFIDDTRASSYGHIMAPQDWVMAMNEFDLGTGAGEIASFVEPYMPFNGH